MSWRGTQEQGQPEVGADAISRTDNPARPVNWPVGRDRQRVRWFPARQRLIGLVRGSGDAFVLPPAVVRKATWRD